MTEATKMRTKTKTFCNFCAKPLANGRLTLCRSCDISFRSLRKENDAGCQCKLCLIRKDGGVPRFVTIPVGHPIRQKYSEKKNVKQVLNQAVRAELAGGAEALDSLSYAANLKHFLNDSPLPSAAIAIERVMCGLLRIKTAMHNEIIRRYDLTPTEDKLKAIENFRAGLCIDCQQPREDVAVPMCSVCHAAQQQDTLPDGF